MISDAPRNDRHAKTLRAWQLAILRFAVTLDDADRLAMLAIAREIDNLAPKDGSKREFGFFRRTSTELCAAILRPNELTSAILSQYLARIDDGRLRRSFAAAMEISQSKASSASMPIKRDEKLWRGLVLRNNNLR
jgi:hypothetical protein